MTTVESVVAEEVDGDDDEAESPASVQSTMSEPAHAESMAESSIMNSSGPPTFKRRRTARTEEYEFIMPPSTREVTVPVPAGAVRAVCSITFHYA